MSIIVYGVDKPNGCRHCPFCIPTEPDLDDSPYECLLNFYLDWATWTDVPDFISEGCKISGISKTHGRLIDADELLKRLNESGNYVSPAITAYIETAPTIIKAEQDDG